MATWGPSFSEDVGLPEPTDEERAAVARQTIRDLGIAIPRAGAAFLTNVGPDPTLPGPLGYIPFTGLAETTAGFAGGLIGGVNAVSKYGLTVDALKHLPDETPTTLRAIGDRASSNEEKILTNLPRLDPEPGNQHEIIAAALGSGVGGMIPVAPGSLIEKLPSVVQKLAPVVVPTTKHMLPNMAVGGGLSAGMTAGVLNLMNNQPEWSPLFTPNDPNKMPTQLPSMFAPQPGTKPMSDATPQDASPVQPVVATNATGDDVTPVTAPWHWPSLISSAEAATPPPTLPPLPPQVTDLFGGGTFAQPMTPPGETGKSDTTVGNTWAAIGAGAAGIGLLRWWHDLGGVVSAAERARRLGSPEAIAEAQRIARQGGPVMTADGLKPSATPPDASGYITPSLPQTSDAQGPKGWVNQFVTNWIQKPLVDDTARIRNYIAATSPDTDTAERLAVKFGMAHNPAAVDAKIREFNATGVDTATGIKVEPPLTYYKELANMDGADRDRLANVIFARNELNNRDRMIEAAQRAAMGPNGTPMQPAENYRFDMNDKTRAEVEAMAQTGPNEQYIKEMADRFRNYGMIIPDIMEARGFITPEEKNRLKAERPDYLSSTDPKGELTHDFGPRDLTVNGGTNKMNVLPWEALDQHINALLPRMEQNDINRALFAHQMDVQQQFPNSPKLMTVKEYGGVPVDKVSGTEPTVQIRNNTGHQHVVVANPELFDVMSANNPTRARINIAGLDSARRIIQSTTTGAGAMLGGKIYPIISNHYAGLLTALNAPRDMRMGPLDRLVWKGQQALRDRGLPIPQTGWRNPILNTMTNYAAMPEAFASNMLAALSHNAGHIFAPGANNAANAFFRAKLGHTNMDQFSKYLLDQYANSNLAWSRAQGLGGHGSPFTHRLNALQYKGAGEGAIARTAATEQVPQLMRLGQTGKIAKLIGQGNVIRYIRMRNLVGELFSQMGDLGPDVFARANRDNPNVSSQRLAYETRRIMGDPANMGSSKVTRALSVIPFFNVGLQGTARSIAGFARPRTMLGLAGAAMSMALIEQLTAMHHSPEAQDYLENELTSQQKGAALRLFLGSNPRAPTEIGIPQEFRGIKAFAHDLISKLLNTSMAKTDPEHRRGLMDMMHDYFSQHIENGTMEAGKQSLNDTVNLFALPSLANAMNDLTGSKAQIDLTRIINDAQDGGINLQTFITHHNDKSLGPNQSPGDTMMDSADGNKYTQALGHILGVAASSISSALNHGAHVYNRGDGWWSAMNAAGSDWWQHAKDANPSLNNVLWQNETKLSPQAPVVDDVERSLRAMDRTAGSKAAGQRPDASATGRYGFQLENPTMDKKLPTDPTMRRMFDFTDQMNQRIKTQYIAPINAIRAQINDIQRGPQAPDVIRHRVNEKILEMHESYYKVRGMIEAVNSQLSHIVGAPVDVRSIDWNKGPEQFHKP